MNDNEINKFRKYFAYYLIFICNPDEIHNFTGTNFYVKISNIITI